MHKSTYYKRYFRFRCPGKRLDLVLSGFGCRAAVVPDVQPR